MYLFNDSNRTHFLVLLVFFLCFFSCHRTDEVDLCKRKPCGNKGICAQTSTAPGYKCQCYGTGFYGSTCKQKCPKLNEQSESGKRKSFLPTECIVI